MSKRTVAFHPNGLLYYVVRYSDSRW